MSCLADVVEVGGTGGDAFVFNGIENGTRLKKMWVWVGAWQVKAMKVWLTDGQSRQFGVPDGDHTEFIFEDGEHFTSLKLWASGNVTRLAAIKFKTNHSREFYARLKTSSWIKEPGTPVDVASGICMGIKGRSASDINRLGFMFLNTIKSTVLKNIEYPTIHDMIPKVAVREIKSMTYHNKSTQMQQYRFETSKKITKKSSWSVTGKVEFSVSLEVNGGIPLIAEGKAGFGLKHGVESTYTKESTEENTELYSFPIQVPPGKTVDVDNTVGQATINLPFNGIVKITCRNGGELQFKTSGTYKGVTYTGGDVVVNETSLWPQKI